TCALPIVIVSIYKTEEDLAPISEKANAIADELRAAGISVKYDDDDKQRSGWKFAEYELKGVPVRLAMGMRDLENGTIEIARRDTLSKETVSVDSAVETVRTLLEQMQQSIFQKALQFREQNTHLVDSWDDFKVRIEQGGFLLAHWDGTPETEEKIKEETKATIRCIPLNSVEESGKCVYSGKDSAKRVIFARAY